MHFVGLSFIIMWEWIGEGTVKKMSGSKPDGSRRRGRPRLRWLKDVEKDLREMKVNKIWCQKLIRKNGRL
jgi:hypothetical protein